MNTRIHKEFNFITNRMLCVCVCACVCVCVHMCAYLCVCIHVCVCVYMVWSQTCSQNSQDVFVWHERVNLFMPEDLLDKCHLDL